jgi:hypothetical protein
VDAQRTLKCLNPFALSLKNLYHTTLFEQGVVKQHIQSKHSIIFSFQGKTTLIMSIKNVQAILSLNLKWALEKDENVKA